MKHLYTDVYDEQTWQQIEQKAELKAHLEKCALAPSLTLTPNLPFTLTLALALALALALPLPLTLTPSLIPRASCLSLSIRSCSSAAMCLRAPWEYCGRTRGVLWEYHGGTVGVLGGYVAAPSPR